VRAAAVVPGVPGLGLGYGYKRREAVIREETMRVIALGDKRMQVANGVNNRRD